MMRDYKVGLIVAAASVGVAWSGTAGAAAAGTVTLSPYIERLVTVEAEIDGQKGKFVLDTGGGVTTLDTGFAGRIGCTPYGEISGFRLSGARVRAQKCGQRAIKVAGQTNRAETLATDLKKLLPPTAPPVDGFIALNAFEGRAITLDLHGRKLTVETDASLRGRVRAHKAGPIRLQRELGGMGITAFAHVPAKTGDLWMLMDSGNMANVLVSPGALLQWGKSQEEAAAAIDKRPIDVPLSVDGAPDAPGKASVKDIIYDGVLNENFLAHYRVTLDLKNQRVWFAPSE